MELNALLLDLFSRSAEHVHEALDGLDPGLLTTSLEPGTNTIAWQVWHLTRVQDDHIADLIGSEQVWTSGNWASRFGVEPDPHNTGYGHSEAEMMAIRPDGVAALLDYHDAVAAVTTTFIERLTATDLDRVVDERWDPPVTMGVRLVSIVDDDIQHGAQAVLTRGVLERRS